MRGFTVADLTAQCEVRLTARYEYELLEQVEGAVDLIAGFSSQVWRSPEAFDLRLDSNSSDPLQLRWRATSNTAGIATLHNSLQTFSLSMVVSGLEVEADQHTLEAFQQFAVQELHNTQHEPSFGLQQLWQRPLLATVGLFVPSDPQQKKLFALADRCFAAAYFRRLQLV